MSSLKIQFPHTLAGMLVLCTGLVVAKSVSGTPARAADAIVDFFQPLLSWVARWMPVFFVPALIALPMSLATASVQAADFLKVGQVMVLGWTASMLLATVAIKVLRSLFHTELTGQEVRCCHALARQLHLSHFSQVFQKRECTHTMFLAQSQHGFDRWLCRLLPLHPSLSVHSPLHTTLPGVSSALQLSGYLLPFRARFLCSGHSSYWRRL